MKIVAKKMRDLIKVGDIVTCQTKVEAHYSRHYRGTPSEYPEQWFTPGMTGVVFGIKTPCVRNPNNKYPFDEFVAIRFIGTDIWKPGQNDWVVGLAYNNIIKLNI